MTWLFLRCRSALYLPLLPFFLPRLPLSPQPAAMQISVARPPPLLQLHSHCSKEQLCKTRDTYYALSYWTLINEAIEVTDAAEATRIMIIALLTREYFIILQKGGRGNEWMKCLREKSYLYALSHAYLLWKLFESEIDMLLKKLKIK